MTWQGLTNDWNNPGNWSHGILPSFQVNVMIPDTAAIFPVITNLPANPAVCMNLVLQDSARLTVQAGKALTVYGDLILDTLEANETAYGLILESETSQVQTGSLILEGNAYGTAIIKRFLAKDNGWHFLSSPVADQDFQPEFVPDPLNNSFDLYYWDENEEQSAGWINCREGNGLWNPQFGETFIPGKGYLVSYSSANPGDLVRAFAGVVTSGNQDISLGHSGNYWNLLGNPYTCAMDWSSDGINKEDVAGSAMYIWDPALNNFQGGYRTHNGMTGVPEGTSPIIPALQGFFVQSLDTGSLSVNVSLDNS
jgi:hypothetical protein